MYNSNSGGIATNNNIKDRTSEFLSVLESARGEKSSSYGLPLEQQRLLQPGLSSNSSSSSSSSVLPPTKTQFAREAVRIGKDISTTMTKLQKLAQLARQKSLFDDKPVEINELIFVIKQDISRITKQITVLQSVGKGGGGGAHAAAASTSSSSSNPPSNRQVEEHSNNVITSLQSKLASTSNLFRDVLEVRTRNMKEQKERRDQYSYGGNYKLRGCLDERERAGIESLSFIYIMFYLAIL